MLLLEEEGSIEKILVIDDEAALRDLIELVLRRENYQVKTAENGSTGLQILDSFQPDLVLLDLMLPDCSGYDLCKEITKKQAMPVIMLSAKNEIIDKVLGLELGQRTTSPSLLITGNSLPGSKLCLEDMTIVIRSKVMRIPG